MRIFEDRPYRDGELFAALRALIQASADFLFGIRFDFPNPILLRVFAVRANSPELPADFF